MDYEKKFILGDLVKGRRTFNDEIVEGKFNGFHLHDNLNPTSVVGVICVESDRCYDVVVESIELLESEDEKIKKAIIATIHLYYGEPLEDEAKDMLAWLEKQGEHKSVWSEEDEKFFKTALWHITNSVSNGKSTDVHCDTTDWLKSLKDRVQQPK